MAYCVWLLLLSMMFLTFIHVIACIGTRHCFMSLNNIPLYVYTTFCLSTHLSIEAWVAFTFWLFVNNAAMNMGVQIPVQVPAFSFGEYRPCLLYTSDAADDSGVV